MASTSTTTGTTDYDRCLYGNKYETVSAGEVCTIDVAKKLGIADPKNYFVKGYEETATNNALFDNGKSVTAKLCKVNSLNSNAMPICQATYGHAYTRKLGTPDMCTVSECPTGFSNIPDAPGRCAKPVVPSTLPKVQQCAERWYDWFTIPNYHLGNRWMAVVPPGGDKNKPVCMQPCPLYFAPHYAYDPSENMYQAQPDDKLDKCINKTQFLKGKYIKQPEYSPLAWIYRLTMTPPLIQQTWLALIEKDKATMKVSDDGEKLKAKIPVMSDMVFRDYLSRQAQLYEDLANPSDAHVAAYEASMKMDGPELKYAYGVCKRMFTPKTSNLFVEEYKQDFNQYEAKEIETRLAILTQSCYQLFDRDVPLHSTFSRIKVPNGQKSSVTTSTSKQLSDKEKTEITEQQNVNENVTIAEQDRPKRGIDFFENSTKILIIGVISTLGTVGLLYIAWLIYKQIRKKKKGISLINPANLEVAGLTSLVSKNKKAARHSNEKRANGLYTQQSEL